MPRLGSVPTSTRTSEASAIGEATVWVPQGKAASFRALTLLWPFRGFSFPGFPKPSVEGLLFIMGPNPAGPKVYGHGVGMVSFMYLC